MVLQQRKQPLKLLMEDQVVTTRIRSLEWRSRLQGTRSITDAISREKSRAIWSTRWYKNGANSAHMNVKWPYLTRLMLKRLQSSQVRLSPLKELNKFNSKSTSQHRRSAVSSPLPRMQRAPVFKTRPASSVARNCWGASHHPLLRVLHVTRVSPGTRNEAPSIRRKSWITQIPTTMNRMAAIIIL